MKLTLTKQTLTELSTDELATVAGGITTILIKSVQDCPDLETVPTFPVLYCATDASS
jgi:bacteriocin-like protein